MSLRRMLFLLIALIASGSTVVVGRMWLQSQRTPVVAEKAPEAIGTAVLVAKGNISAGSFIRMENLKWQPWPESGLAPSYVVEGKRPIEAYLGSVARVGLSDGEPITDIRVVKPGDRGFLAVVLHPGYRAVTVNLTPSSGLAGLVFPGDRIDLVATFRVPDDNKNNAGIQRYASETVIGDLRILAVDQRIDDQTKGTDIVVAKTATLEVTPKQAEMIAIVSELGKFSLSLRSLGEGDAVAMADKDHSEFTWDSEAARMLTPPNMGSGGSGRTVSIVRGGAATDVEFPRSTR
jgi:pilus assembly protein CpaB